jgi:hypothetical protein
MSSAITTHYVNQLALAARVPTVEGLAAQEELRLIADMTPKANYEAEAIRMAQRWVAGQLDVAASNKPWAGPRGPKPYRRHS